MALIFNMLCLAVAVENFVSVYAIDYCNIKCEKEVHTMCTYTVSTIIYVYNIYD